MSIINKWTGHVIINILQDGIRNLMPVASLIILYVTIVLNGHNFLYIWMVKHLHYLELVRDALILILILLVDKLYDVLRSSLVDAPTLLVHVLVRCDIVFII